MLARVDNHLGGGKNSSNVSKKSSRDMTSSDLKSTTAGSTGRQSSSSKLSTQPDREPSGLATTTAGRLSSDAKVTARERSTDNLISSDGIVADPLQEEIKRILLERPDTEIPVEIRSADGQEVTVMQKLRDVLAGLDREEKQVQTIRRCYVERFENSETE